MLAALIAVGLCQPAPAEAATLTIRFTNNELPLMDPTLAKFYVYEPEKRENYLAWGHGAKAARIPDGTYDVVVRYHDDLVTEERVFEAVEIEGQMEQEIDFLLPKAELTVAIHAGGKPIPPFSGSYNVHRAGQRGKPLTSRRPGESVVLPPGSYDIEAVYRGPGGLQSRWLERYYVEDFKQETVLFGATPLRLRLTLLENGRPVAASRGRWRVYPPGLHDVPLKDRASGEAADLEAGTYDLFLSYGGSSGDVERWLNDVVLRDDEHRQIEIAGAAGSLMVRTRRDGRNLPEAWFAVYRRGDRSNPMRSAPGGSVVDLQAGRYDIGCFYRKDGIVIERWVENREVDGRVELDVELDYEPATLQVMPPRTDARSGDGSNILFVLDSSAAMREDMGNRSRFEFAREALEEAVETLHGQDVKVALRVFGIAPETQSNCEDSALLLPLDDAEDLRLETTIGLLRPAGIAPLAYSVEQATADLPPAGRNTVILLTGSVDGCGADVCRAAARLLRIGAAERIHIVALNVGDAQRRQLACAGSFHNVRRRSQLRRAMQDILRTTLDERGSVSVFKAGWGAWVVSGSLGEDIELAAGTYDLLIRTNKGPISWKGVNVRGDFRAVAGTQPLPKR
jgi:hypothetical protein